MSKVLSYTNLFKHSEHLIHLIMVIDVLAIESFCR